MQALQPQFHRRVRRGLDAVFPPEPQDAGRRDYAQLAQRYLDEFLTNSLATPDGDTVVVFAWQSLSTMKLAAAVKELDDAVEARDHVRIRELEQKVEECGHVAIAWQGAGGPATYASFWPGGGGTGRWHSFVQDLVAEEKLPDNIFVNLTYENAVRLRGKHIKTWDRAALDAEFARLQAPVPPFDLLCEAPGSYNCSKMALNFIRIGCVRVDAFAVTKEMDKAWDDNVTSVPGKLLTLLPRLVTYVGTAAVDGLTEINTAIKDAAEEKLEDANGLNPHYIINNWFNRVMKSRCDVWNEGRPFMVTSLRLRDVTAKAGLPRCDGD